MILGAFITQAIHVLTNPPPATTRPSASTTRCTWVAGYPRRNSCSNGNYFCEFPGIFQFFPWNIRSFPSFLRLPRGSKRPVYRLRTCSGQWPAAAGSCLSSGMTAEEQVIAGGILVSTNDTVSLHVTADQER